MGQKKITELQLISSITGAIMFPVDNAIQTYRATVAQVKDYLYAAAQAKEIITNQTEDTNPDKYGDLVMTYDLSGTTAKKVRLTNLVATRSGFRNLTGVNNSGTPNTQYDIAADEVILTNSNGHAIAKFATGTLTNNISTAGSAANGRDQSGAFTDPSFIHFWLIYNPTTDTLATLSSASSSAPTLPTDYTHKAYVGCVYYASSALRVVYIRGKDHYMKTGVTALSGGTSTSDASQSVSTIVPPNALDYTFNGRITGDENGSQEIDITATMGVGGTTTMYNFRLGMRGGGAFTPYSAVAGVKLPNVSQTFYFKLTNTLGTNGNLTGEICHYTMPNGAA